MWDDDDEQDAQRIQAAADGCVWVLIWIFLFVVGFCWWLVHYFGKGS